MLTRSARSDTSSSYYMEGSELSKVSYEKDLDA